MPRKRRSRVTLPPKGKSAARKLRTVRGCHPADEAHDHEAEEECNGPVEFRISSEVMPDQTPWTWGDFLLGVDSESAAAVTEECEGEKTDCDGGRAQAFFVIVEDEAIPYNPEDVLDLDIYASSLAQEHRLRALAKIKAELREEDLGIFTVLQSHDDAIQVVACQTATSRMESTCGHASGIKFFVTVHEDFSICVQVHTETLPSTHSFWSGLPTRGNSSGAVLQVLSKLASSRICCGNTDQRMQKLVPEKSADGTFAGYREGDVGAAYSSTVRSVRCMMVLPLGDGKIRCRACAIFRKTLLKRVSRCPLKTNLTSSRVAHRYFTREELCEKLSQERRERRVLKFELDRVKKAACMYVPDSTKTSLMS